MTIDERLERLTDRHEALAESVESLLASFREAHATAVQDGENIRALQEMHRTNEEGIGKLQEAIGKLAQAQTDLTVTMNRLANIVIRHEERLDAIDGGDA